MRSEKEIKSRIEELKENQKIANNMLQKVIHEKNEKEEKYWSQTIESISGQIYGMKFSIGEYE